MTQIIKLLLETKVSLQKKRKKEKTTHTQNKTRYN